MPSFGALKAADNGVQSPHVRDLEPGQGQGPAQVLPDIPTREDGGRKPFGLRYDRVALLRKFKQKPI